MQECLESLNESLSGNISSKEDEVIVIFAEEAITKGYQVLSFDLPEHGDRKNEAYACNVQNCVSYFTAIVGYAHTINISLLACSMGASRKLYSRHNDVDADIIVAWAVKRGILLPERIPEDLLEEIKGVMALYD